jgi:hypothetical protein
MALQSVEDSKCNSFRYLADIDGGFVRANLNRPGALE